MRIAPLLWFAASALWAAPRIQVKLGPETGAARDGRLIVIVSKAPQGEPRFQVTWGLATQQIFGIDVDRWNPGEAVEMDGSTPGAPLHTLADLPPGAYNVQAVLNIYQTFHRADGHTVKLHADHGEGQQWNRSPGNLYSKPQRVEVRDNSTVQLALTETIPPIDPPTDTKYIRHVRVQSKLLSDFWGSPMFIESVVLVPRDFDTGTEHYPVAFLQGHFGGDFFRFRDTPPAAGNAFEAQAYQFYQDWTSGRLPRMLLVVTNHATPYYDDSYGVNTANTGPYGDALTTELYPEVERRFRGIGQSWARVVFGGSTGGWMTLAQQIFYPDYFGGAWGFCPDPVDFHAFQHVNVYQDSNAYYDQGPFERFPKLVGRLPNDHILATMESFSRQEMVLGTRGRSGGQMDAFHATFGPTDAVGYPAKLWDAETGAINPEVAKYWREHYDLTAMLQRDWDRLGMRLAGKIHVTMGTKDTFYLDAAAHRMQDFLDTTRLPGKGPYYAGSFDYGNNKPHCYAGDIPDGVPMLSYFVKVFADYMRGTAPKGTDLDTWR
jgi:enterochelin esterase-like enzyme